MTVGIVIRELESSYFDKLEDETKRTNSEKDTFKDLKAIKLDSFKKAYINPTYQNEANIYVKTDKDNYFLFATGLKYRISFESDYSDAQEIINKIFN